MSPVPAPSRLKELSQEELAIYQQLDPERLPKHIAIIMDGNGRWAGQRRMQRFFGHQQGAESVQFVVEQPRALTSPGSLCMHFRWRIISAARRQKSVFSCVSCAPTWSAM